MNLNLARGMTLLMLGAGWLGGCAEETFDASEPAMDGVRAGVRSIDETLVRARDVRAYDATVANAEQYGGESRFDGERWVFVYPDADASFEFRDANGDFQREPDDDTHQMTIDGTQVVTSLFGVPADVRAWSRSNTVGLKGSTPSMVATWGQQDDLQFSDGDVHVRLESRIDVDATVRIVDRGAGWLPRYCPEGRIDGVSEARGESTTDRPGATTYDFEAHFEGRELVWQAFDGDDFVDQGRMLSTLAEGC
jgi:hypothetical protein